MDEQTFLEEPGMKITSARIEIFGKTFATRNVGSVSLKFGEVGMFPIVLGLVGVVVLTQPAVWFIGLCLLVAAVAIGRSRSRQRTVSIVAGGGETQALETDDDAMARRVHEAIVNAISVR